MEQGKIMEAEVPTIRVGATPSGLTALQCPTPTTPKVFTGRMPFLPPNQQRQSTEGTDGRRKCTPIIGLYALDIWLLLLNTFIPDKFCEYRSKLYTIRNYNL